MITKAQGHKLQREAAIAVRPKLTAMERGLLTWAVLDPGDKVLDMSPFGGLMLEYLARHMECEICGVSGDMECVRQARTRLQNADIVYANAEDIPWREKSFDVVFLQKWKTDEADWEAVLREVLRVLKPGGQFLLGVDNSPVLLRRMASLIGSDAGEGERSAEKGKAEWIKTMDMVGYEQVSWQRVDMLFKGIAIGWKPLEQSMEQ